MTAKRAILVLLLLVTGLSFAQFGPRSRSRRGTSGNWIRIEGGQVVNEDELRTARETDPHSDGAPTPNWTNAPGFERDVFTFARVIFQSDPGPRDRGWARWLGWWVDYPDADLNISYRLQELTSIRTDPDGRVLKLTDPAINDFPLLYMEHAGYMRLEEEEIAALRKYLLNGGALFVNDFWGSEEWNGFAAQIKKVLPNRNWTELSIDHPIFHSVYDLRGPMKKLQVPTLQFWNREQDPNDPRSPLQTRFRGEGSETMHVRAIYDDRQRMMIFVIHNSDVSDGWEREGHEEDYFNVFSERVSYPLGINIIFYLMTH